MNTQKAPKPDPRTVHEVMVRNRRCERFTLTSGKFVYMAAVDNGFGTMRKVPSREQRLRDAIDAAIAASKHS
ncbi:hypothetical protein [Paraburkholderia sp. HD33-4]|uniref:hypothetical protein n=1 Tax=Paraburkholderia sp. HD33-4 TaxID=2883242 RepID=UPI001F2C5045|nr:hypothetical protein [Paraburkholderia sp. HD33-4]